MIKIKKWSCPYCGGKTIPVALSDLENEEKLRIIEELKSKETPVIVKCTKCSRVWVNEA